MRQTFLNPPCAAALLLLLLTGAVSCGEKELDVTPSEDKGYAEHPILSFRAQDADGRWIDAAIDDVDRNIVFEFRARTDLDNIPCILEVDPGWGARVSPETRDFNLNLSAAQTITVNDGIDDLRYRVSGQLYQQIRGLRGTAGEETVSTAPVGSHMTLKFVNTVSRDALSGVQVQLDLAEDAELVAPLDLSALDLNGKMAEIKVLDKTIGYEKTYTLAATAGSAIETGPGRWEDVSLPWSAAHDVTLPDHIAIYQTTSLSGTAGRTGWAIVITGGRVEGQLKAKADFSPTSRSKVSLALEDNPGHTVFVPYQGPGMWRVSATASNSYISPVVYRNGNFARVPSFGTPPVLGVKDGKAEIRYAWPVDGVLYHFAKPHETPTAADGAPWEVDFAAGGCFMLVQDGANLVGGEDSRSQSNYRQEWTPIPDVHTFITPDWSNWKPLETYMTQRSGRTAIGCTAEGAVVILQTEMLINSHAQPQWTSTTQDGSTVYEVAQALVDMGCTSGALWEENYWNTILLQDGGAYREGNLRGAEFFPHQRRHFLDTTASHQAGDLNDAEFENLYVLMFK
ncbi:MAG: hypothetical protein IJ721_06560 [Bacteroidales bacterium]|nr:hypothetical protein [Bacteroidales bacterium]